MVSSVASPPILSTLLILFSALDTGGLRMWDWVVMQVSTSMVLPCFYVLYLVRRGKITDIEIYQRRQRYIPNLIFFACALLSLILLLVFQAPAELVMVSGAGLMLLFILSVVNYLYKISAHVAAASIFAFILWRIGGNALIPGFSLIPLMAWSRLTLHRHTRGQVIAGFLAGVVVFGVVFL
jgi:membrane-associated phospholipid phosphatase